MGAGFVCHWNRGNFSLDQLRCCSTNRKIKWLQIKSVLLFRAKTTWMLRFKGIRDPQATLKFVMSFWPSALPSCIKQLPPNGISWNYVLGILLQLVDMFWFWLTLDVNNILFSRKSRRVLGSTQPPTRGVRGYFPEGTVAEGVKLSSILHLVPKLRMQGAITSLIHKPSWHDNWLNTGTKLPFILYQFF